METDRQVYRQVNNSWIETLSGSEVDRQTNLSILSYVHSVHKQT